MPIISSFDYTSRDYSSIRQDLLDRAAVAIPEWTSRDPGDFVMMLVELEAYCSDILHYYIDRAAQESFLRTAALRRSVLDIANMMDYVPVAQAAAVGTVTFTRASGATGNVTIPIKTTVMTLPTTVNDLPVYFETDVAVTLLSANTTINAAVTEGRTTTSEPIGMSEGVPNQQFSLYHTGVIGHSITVSVLEGAGGSGVAWLEVDRLIDATATENVFTTSVNEDGVTFVRFGDNVTGRIPPKGIQINATYRYGFGARGNVGIGSISALTSSVTGIGAVTNAAPTSGGEDRESIDSMRIAIPQSLRAQDRAVTLDDYASLPLKVPGVTKANAYWTTGTPNDVFVYVAPSTAVAPSTPLKTSVLNYIEARKVIGKTVTVNNPTYVGINVTLAVTVIANRVREWVRAAVEAAVRALFAFDTVDFAERQRIGDVYHTVIEVDGVDYFTLSVFSTTGSGVADIALAYNQIAIPGTISVTATGGIG